tara:strand:- start:175 stop:426 length:252 start_codon:yes stop_codon:yes gene_type:complete
MQELDQKINKAIEGKVPCNGRPIMLSHVLKYLRNIPDWSIWYISHYFEFTELLHDKGSGIFWNMDSILLSDQSDDLKKFLIDL